MNDVRKEYTITKNTVSAITTINRNSDNGIGPYIHTRFIERTEELNFKLN